MTRTQWIIAGVALLVVGWFWYSRSSTGSQTIQSSSPGSSLSVTPFYSMSSLAQPAYMAGTVPVVSNTGGVTPVNVADYLSAFTSAPAIEQPTIGLIPELQNYGGLSSSTYAQNNMSTFSGGASYGMGGFSIGASGTNQKFAQNTISNTTLTSGQNVTFAGS